MMNRYVKEGLKCATPGLIAIPIVVGYCAIGYLVVRGIDPLNTGIFFYWWGLIFTVAFLFLAVIGFIGGMVCEYKSIKKLKNVIYHD